jgi:hypothetical protein
MNEKNEVPNENLNREGESKNDKTPSITVLFKALINYIDLKVVVGAIIATVFFLPYHCYRDNVNADRQKIEDFTLFQKEIDWNVVGLENVVSMLGTSETILKTKYAWEIKKRGPTFFPGKIFLSEPTRFYVEAVDTGDSFVVFPRSNIRGSYDMIEKLSKNGLILNLANRENVLFLKTLNNSTESDINTRLLAIYDDLNKLPRRSPNKPNEEEANKVKNEYEKIRDAIIVDINKLKKSCGEIKEKLKVIRKDTQKLIG